jgi:heparinase II/III-like protein
VPSGMTSPPRRLFCVYEHRYRSREIAEDVARGLFPIQGVTLDLGQEPDWLAAPLPEDPEWRLEWSKFYYGLDLATAAEETGDARFLHAWQRLVRSWIVQVPIDRDPSDVIGRRIQNWIYAWSRFAERFDCDGHAPGFSAAITLSLSDQIAHLERHLTRERNHRTLELYALFAAALALTDLDPDGRLRRFSSAAIIENLLTDVLPDGVQRERSTHYHHVVLRSFIGFRENARRFGVEVPAEFDERLARACEFALHCHRPDGGIPALSDSDGGSYLDLLAVAGRLLDRPDFTYAATGGRSGSVPAARHATFPDGGYFVQRSGWGDSSRAMADERYLIFDCGPLGDGGHGHYDALSVEMAADGAALVVDPGRYTYCDAPPHWRRWFKGTAAHNTVTVDGLDQTPYRRGKPKGPVAEARLLHRLSGTGLDVLWGEVRSPEYDVVHRRRIFFVADEYWLIEDVLEAVDTHRYELRFHLTPDADGRIALVTESGCTAAVAPRAVIVGTVGAASTIETGWVSQEYGIKRQAPVVVFTLEAAGDARFLTLVMPMAAGERLPAVSDRQIGDVWVSDVRRPDAGTRDRIAWTADGSNAAAASSLPGGVASWQRRFDSGTRPDPTVLRAGRETVEQTRRRLERRAEACR